MDPLPGPLYLRGSNDAERPCSVAGLMVTPDTITACLAFPERKCLKVGMIRIKVSAFLQNCVDGLLTAAAINLPCLHLDGPYSMMSFECDQARHTHHPISVHPSNKLMIMITPRHR